MAGASIALHHKIDDAAVLRAFERLREFGGDPGPALEDFGEYWLNSHQERWADEQSPDGTPWADLSEDYKARKPKNPDRILFLDGDLRDLLNYQVDGASLALGTPLKKGATHQFGADKGEFGRDSRGRPIPWGDIPARPYLGMSDADAAELKATMLEHAGRALGD